MRRIFLALLLLVFCAILGSAQNTTLTGTMVIPGNTGFNGTLYLQLSQPAGVLPSCATPAYVVPVTQVSVTLLNGAMVGTNKVWGADCLNPSGVPYNVTVKDSNGNTVVTDQWVIVGSTFNIGTAASTLNTTVNYVAVPGPQGIPGPGSINGLTSNGTNGINVAGTVAAGAVTSGGNPVLTSTPSLGAIYNASSWSSLAAFTSNGTTPTITSNALVFSGGADNFTQTLDYTYNSDLMQWSETMSITVGTPSSTSYGIGVGKRSNIWDGSFAESVACGLDLSTLGTSGKASIYLFNGTGMSAAATSLTAVTFASGNSVQITCARNYDTYTVSAYNVTTGGAAVSASYQYDLTPGTIPFASENSGRFAIWNFGGTQTVTSLNISSLHPVGLDAIAVGDSKTIGQAAGYYVNSWSGLLQNNFRSGTNAGGTEVTQDTLSRVSELIALKPKIVVLCIGRNDVAFGIPLATTEAYYASLVSQLQAAGIVVYHLLPLFETSGVNYVPLTSWITSTYGASNTISVPALNNAAYLSSDTVHPNAAGHALIYQAVLAYLQGKGNAVTFTPQKLVNNVTTLSQLFPSTVASADASPSIFTSNLVTAGSINPSLNLYTAVTSIYQGTAVGEGWFFNGTNNLHTFYQPTQAGAGWSWCTYPNGTPLSNTSQLTCTILPQHNRLLSAPSSITNTGGSPYLQDITSVPSNTATPGLNYGDVSASPGLYAGGVMIANDTAWPSPAQVIYYQPNSWGGFLDCTYVGGTALSTSISTALTCTQHIGTTRGGMLAETVGTAIASATTIAPTSLVVHVTGTTAIATITPPTGCTTSGTACEFKLIPDGLSSTTTGGNIAIASTFVVGKTEIYTYDPATSKWYPSY